MSRSTSSRTRRTIWSICWSGANSTSPSWCCRPAAPLSALQTETVEVSPYRVWLPLGHPPSPDERVSLRDLAGEPHVLLTVDEIAEAPEIVWRRLGIRPPVAFRTRSVEAVRSLVATGAGVAVLPDLTYRPWSLEGDKIEARALVEELPAIEVGIVWRRGSPPVCGRRRSSRSSSDTTSAGGRG